MPALALAVYTKCWWTRRGSPSQENRGCAVGPKPARGCCASHLLKQRPRKCVLRALCYASSCRRSIWSFLPMLLLV